MEAKLKHLEFIQDVISRMATNSFLFKGWTVTIAAALSSFGAIDSRIALFVIAVASTCLFWGLDAYYLWLERCFINVYEEVSKKSETDIDFSMKFDKKGAARRWFGTCWRPHLVFFYGTIVAIEVIGISALGGQ